MRKFLVLWLVASVLVLVLPNAIDRFIPKVIYKEIPIYRVKKEIQYVEKEVFKGERIVEKEKVVYQPTPSGILVAQKISDQEYLLTINNPQWGQQAELVVKDDGVHIRNKSQRLNYQTESSPCVSMSSVGWYN